MQKTTIQAQMYEAFSRRVKGKIPDGVRNHVIPQLFTESQIDEMHRQDLEIEKMAQRLSRLEQEEQLKNKKPVYERLYKNDYPKRKISNEQVRNQQLERKHTKDLQSYDRNQQFMKEYQKCEQLSRVLAKDVKRAQEVSIQYVQDLKAQAAMNQITRQPTELETRPEYTQLRNEMKHLEANAEFVVENNFQKQLQHLHDVQDGVAAQQKHSENDVIQRMMSKKQAVQEIIRDFIIFQQQCENYFAINTKLKTKQQDLRLVAEMETLLLQHEALRTEEFRLKQCFSEHKSEFQTVQPCSGTDTDAIDSRSDSSSQDDKSPQSQTRTANSTFLTVPQNQAATVRPPSPRKQKMALFFRVLSFLQKVKERINEIIYDDVDDEDSLRQLLQQRNVVEAAIAALQAEAVLQAAGNYDALWRLHHLQSAQQYVQ